MNNLTVTIMAAGEGKRMNSDIPKVLHLFKGIPMLVRIVLEVIKLKTNKIIVITGKYHELIKKCINNYFIDNKIVFDFNNILFIQQKIPQGTADAIKTTLSYYTLDENILILNGDMPLISYELLSKFIQTINNKLLITKLDVPYGYGRILYNQENKFIGIKEEKDCSYDEKQIKYVNVGIYYFESIILKQMIPLISNNNIQKEYYLTDIIKIIKENSDVEVETFEILDDFKYQILGVNTQDELFKLENM
jgi:bifunctional N-acetylglucosamine-1-phosphate-uridyltransferase/glucosamine-1-phosphate-acetyltransferase GlmU-like protein